MIRGRRKLDYVPGPTPNSLDQVLPYLRREFQAIALAVVSPWDLPLTTEAPDKAQLGMMRYADGTGWDPGGGEGVYVYMSTGWVKL